MYTSSSNHFNRVARAALPTPGWNGPTPGLLPNVLPHGGQRHRVTPSQVEGGGWQLGGTGLEAGREPS